MEAVTEALEIVAPALPPSHCTHAATMRCDVPCDRDASDATAIRNARATIYFLLLHHHTVDHLVLFLKCRHPARCRWQGGAPTVQRLGDRPWLMGKGFYTPSLVPLFTTQNPREGAVVPVHIFSDECHVVRSVDRHRPDEMVPGGSSVDSARICNVRSEQRTETAGHSRRVK